MVLEYSASHEDLALIFDTNHSWSPMGSPIPFSSKHHQRLQAAERCIDSKDPTPGTPDCAPSHSTTHPCAIDTATYGTSMAIQGSSPWLSYLRWSPEKLFSHGVSRKSSIRSAQKSQTRPESVLGQSQSTSHLSLPVTVSMDSTKALPDLPCKHSQTLDHSIVELNREHRSIDAVG